MSSHTLSVLVENQSGVLARVAALFARRGFNIDSLAVGETEDPAVSRMTIVVDARNSSIEQISKQLHKLINVLRICELPKDAAVERELALVKVNSSRPTKAEIVEIADIFKAKVVDVTPTSMVLEASGASEKIDALEELLVPFGILEIVRTGRIALGRGPSGLKAPNPHPITLVRAAAS
ncbi:MAG TPA: acetolactate synthase small subunit [Actinomycetota bacterium]|nr:acetolactate synthase small subunit [Actinomycetota bacterium]